MKNLKKIPIFEIIEDLPKKFQNIHWTTILPLCARFGDDRLLNVNGGGFG